MDIKNAKNSIVCDLRIGLKEGFHVRLSCTLAETAKKY
jgi:hypothetical protein